MDDYSINTLTESKNEWCARLVNLLTPCIIEGLKSIFKESLNLCLENDEEDKYLMTFQNFLSRVPKWNSQIIDQEKERIISTSGCGYIEDLITCVHIIQLKALTCTRVGMQQKKIDIDIPSLSIFLHKTYINVARKIYTNIYLFEKDILPLQIQKNNRELELIIKETILNTVRDNIPVENILRAYLDETEEQNVEVEERQEIIPLEKTDEKIGSEGGEKGEIKTDDNANDKDKNAKETKGENIKIETLELKKEGATDDKASMETVSMGALELNTKKENEKTDVSDKQGLQFSDIDIAVSTEGVKEAVEAPKDIETLEQIARVNNERRKEEEAAEAAEEEGGDDEILNIGEEIKLDFDNINDLSVNPKSSNEILLKDIEVL
jgi:hypothetical protein